MAVLVGPDLELCDQHAGAGVDRREHAPSTDHRPGGPVHAAACHACVFASQTSCERGNRFLDRATVVPTLASGGPVGFFGAW